MKLPSLATFLVLSFWAPLSLAVEATADAQLKDLQTEIQAQSAEGQLDLPLMAEKLQTLVAGIDLSPSEGLYARTESLKKISSALLEGLHRKGASASEAEQNTVANAIKALLTKLDGLIDENYQFQEGSANVAPPPGTPNAAAGMDPNAIENPQLRQQYLDAIEQEKQKNLKNRQQRDLNGTLASIIITLAGLPDSGIPQNTVVEKFTTQGQSRNALMARFLPPGK